MAGDFNVIRSPEEKTSRGRITSSMRSFNKFIDDSGLVDLLLVDGKFTWANSRAATRIDRFLAAKDWIGRSGNSRQTRGPRVTSDH